MSLIDNGNGMYMNVVPAGGAYGNNNGMFGDGMFWVIVLLLFAAMGGNWGGFGGGGGYAAMPYMMNNNTNNDVQRGFDHQAVMTGIGAIQAGQNSLAQSQAQGFFNAETAAQNRQMASMQQSWNAQTAIDGRLDTLAMNQATGACDSRAAIADLKYALATESANTRQAGQANTQTIMDKLCQMELDGIKQNYENRIATMQAQMDALSDQVNRADRRVAMAEEIDGLYNRLNSCPVPTTPVYGRTPIFTCDQSQAPGCSRCNQSGQFLA